MRFKYKARDHKDRWHDWFAWHPVKHPKRREFVWFETICRCRYYKTVTDGDGYPVEQGYYDYIF